jgi:hypothetical protein
MLVQVRDIRKIARMSPRRARETRGGSINIKLEELQRRIEELKNKRLGDVETYSKYEDEPKEENFF